MTQQQLQAATSLPNSNLKYFLDVLVPPLLVTIGIISNILVLLIYSRKRFDNLPTRNIWRLLSLVDIFCLLQITKYFLKNTFQYDVYLVSPLSCKLVAFLTHCGVISSWLHVYLTLERFFSILNPKVSFSLHRHHIPICLAIMAFYILFYSQRFIYNGLYINSLTNQTVCGTLYNYKRVVIVYKWIDTGVSTVVPFLLMLISSLYLIHSIFSSRRRMSITMIGCNRNAKVRRDIKFSASLVFINMMFVLFKSPAIVYLSMGGSRESIWFSFLDDLYYSYYAFNFFFYAMSNSIFNDEYRLMIRMRRSSGLRRSVYLKGYSGKEVVNN